MVAKNNFYSAILMMLHALSVALLLTIVKRLNQKTDPTQVVFFYKFFLLILFAPSLIYNFKKLVYTKRLKTYFIAGIIGTAASLLYIYSLKHITLANAVILTYMEKVLLVITGVFYFKEKIKSLQILAIISSLFGVCIVILPKLNIGGFNPFYLYALLSVMLWSVYCLFVKDFGKTETTQTQVFYTALFSTIISFPVAFIDFQNNFTLKEFSISLQDVPLFGLAAIFYWILTVTAFKSYKYGDLALIAPLGYTKIVFAAILGIIFFEETPSTIELLGYLLVILSSYYLTKSIYKKKLPHPQDV
jgi:drug/metabolite transporter (DMT)-like permease